MSTSTTTLSTPTRPFPSHQPSPHTPSSNANTPTLSRTTSTPLDLASPLKPMPKNYHPYLIQSTSSSLLTRSNSSPAQPLQPLGMHRSSRSMSSLAYVDSPAAEGDDDRRRSLDSPSAIHGRPGMKRSGTAPSLLDSPAKGGGGEVDVVGNPKLWSPSELAQYLATTLRIGGPDGVGQVLPAPLVEDIRSWVLRHQVTGRAFLKGSAESWASSARPPPFLPTLLSISRRLRRHSLQNSLSRTTDSCPSLSSIASPTSGPTGSVLLEADEDGEDDGDVEYSEISGVRRMANRFEASSDTSAEDEAEKGALKPQWTGGSNGSAAGWKRWSGQALGRKRRESDMSSVSAGESVPSPVTGKREVSGSSNGSAAEVLRTPALESEESMREGDEAGGGTIKARDVMPPVVMDDAELLAHPTPPPPYVSPPRKDRDHTPLSNLRAINEDRTEVTPTPERPRPTLPTGLGISSDFQPSDECDSRPRYPTGTLGRHDPAAMEHLSADKAWDEDELEGSRWTTARRVTLRPNPVNQVFEPSSSPSAPLPTAQASSSDVVDIQDNDAKDERLKGLLDRIEELESRLASVEHRPPTPPAPGRPSSPVLALFPDVLLDKLGLGRPKPGDDGLPKSFKELPAYLFLVGIGVGAVMVKVLFRRR